MRQLLILVQWVYAGLRAPCDKPKRVLLTTKRSYLQWEIYCL